MNTYKKILTIALLITLSGCGAVLKFRATFDHSSYDVPMAGKNATRDFSSASTFTFPLEMHWEYDASAGFGNGSPVVSGNAMIFGTLQGELHAIDIETGNRLSYIKSFSPITSSPVIYNDHVIFGNESAKENLVSIDARDGSIQWTRSIGGIVASPFVKDDLLFVGGLDGKFYCYEARYGTKQWMFDSGSPIRSAPCALDDLVYVATSNGTVYALTAKNGEQQWKYQTKNAVFAGLTVHDGKLIVASRDSTVHILDAKNGTLLNTIVTNDKIMSTPAVAIGILYVPSLDGSLSAYSLSDGTLQWKFQSKSAINTTPIITSNAIFVASLDQHLYALSLSDGSVLWKHDLESRIKTTPLVWKNFVIVVAEDRNIYCFRAKE